MDVAYWRALAEIDGEILGLVDVLFASPRLALAGGVPRQARAVLLERGRDLTPALQLCESCPVWEPCAEAGADEPHGIWAGLSARGRRRAARRTAA